MLYLAASSAIAAIVAGALGFGVLTGRAAAVARTLCLGFVAATLGLLTFAWLAAPAGATGIASMGVVTWTSNRC